MQDNLQLNIPLMDKMHDDFLDLLSTIKSCNDSEFLQHFEEIINHTKEHFASEESIMTEQNFYGRQEHLDEHINLLNEMIYFYEKARKFPTFGKPYINDYAYEKFKRHIINIDSQFAMFLKEQNISS
ncbi:hemerythrin [Sulfurovum sp. zt1-1]|uniref:Hemerythrin n=1 Tax=Sulfurovum zhangzhouensis TaxID=3019067 RepID=A0ABT7QVG9_9BACT|nr:hemerythrin domain-containing protein [Sulfurovum zhangzhouensis]MDM5270843.1 hemerythrin [Sulfurovum zhangzhouensis]